MKQEKRMAKRIFSVLLTLAMLFVSFPAAFSFGAVAASATSGKTGDCTWTLDGTVLTISGNGAMADYSYSERAPWSTDITEVVIGSGVTDLGGYAFSGCTSLTSITIPDSVTSIGDAAFSGCTSLTSITIPDSVTSIGGYAFYFCTSLTSITLPDSVTRIKNGAFDGCKSLTSITLPDSVTSIGDLAFSGCKSLTSINIPANVTSIGSQAFFSCSNLKRVDITNIEKWCAIEFEWKASPLCGTGAVPYLNGRIIEDIVIPDGMTSVGDYAFYGFSSVTSITIPDSVTSIGHDAFYGCTSLTSITLPDGITDIGSDAFTSTGYYNDPANWNNGVLYISNHLINAKSTLSGNYTIKAGTKCIGDSAFMDCTSLTSVTIPDSVTSIGNAAFGGCKNLTIRTPENSAAHKYAKSEGINYYLTSVTTQPSVPTVDGSQKADESSVTVTLRAVAGYEYRCNDGAWQKSPLFSGLPFGGLCRFYQRLAESEKSVAGPVGEALVVKLKSKCTAVPDAPQIASKKLNRILLKEQPGYEYSMDGKAWQPTGLFTGLTSDTEYTFYQRIAETEDTFVSISSQGTKVRTSYCYILYDANGGTGEPGTQEVKSENDTISSEVPQRKEYTFAGWNSLNDPVTVYQPGDVFKGSENVTLYAMWIRNCDKCDATGKIRTQERVACGSCHGTGERYKCNNCGSSNVTFHTTGFGSYWQCNRCGGASVSRTSCTACSGSGYTTIYHVEQCSACAGLGQLDVEAPIVVSFTDTEVVLKVKSGYEYSKDGMHFQKSHIFGGLSPKTTYSFYQRKARNGSSPFGARSLAAEVTTDRSTPEAVPAKPIMESRTENSIVLKNIPGYEYRLGNGNWQTISTFTGLDCGTEYVFYQRVAATETSYAGRESPGATFKTEKGVREAPKRPALEKISHNMIVLKRVEGCEYSKDGVTWQTDNRFAGLSASTGYTFYQRFAENDRYFSSSASQGLTIRTNEQPLYTPGDLDGDEEITEADAIYLLMASYFPEQYPLDQSCDYDGDGEITEADAIYLLMASYFPEQYPL